MNSSKNLEITIQRILANCEKNGTFHRYERDIHDMILQLPQDRRVDYLKKIKKYQYQETKETVIENHDELTEKISEAAKELKMKTLLIHDALEQDKSLLDSVHNATDQNTILLNKGRKKITEVYTSQISKLQLLMIAGLLFMFVYFVIKIFPK